MTACIVGWAHSRFGKLEGKALELAIIWSDDLNEIVLGYFNDGFSAQDSTVSFVLQSDDRLRFKPATRVGNACAIGSAVVQQGIHAVNTSSLVVLVIGAKQIITTPRSKIGKNLLKASYLPEDGDTPVGFSGTFGRIAQPCFQRYGDQSDALAMSEAKNKNNDIESPYAHMCKDFGFDFCRQESEKNLFVAGALKRTDCSLVSDGAAALILTDSTTALHMRGSVAFRAKEHVQYFLPMSKHDILKFEGCEVAWKKALKSACEALDDLSFAETH